MKTIKIICLTTAALLLAACNKPAHAQEHSASSDAAIASAKQTAALMQQVDLIFLLKTFVPHDYDAQRMDDRIVVTVVVRNLSKTKAIAGVKGIATFKDVFGTPILKTMVSITQDIPAGTNQNSDLQVDFNPFVKEDVAFRDYDAAKIKFTFEPTMIVYDDGSTLEAVDPDLAMPPPPK